MKENRLIMQNIALKTVLKRILVSAAAFAFLFAPLSPMGAPTAYAKAKPSPVVSIAPAVKKSVNKICHAKGTRYYNQTKTFTAYKALKDCIKSGGRMPK